MTERRHAMYYQRRQWDKACRRADLREECPPRRPWSEDDNAMLRRNYPRGDVWCAVRLNRTPEAARWHMMALRSRDALAAFARGWLA